MTSELRESVEDSAADHGSARTTTTAAQLWSAAKLPVVVLTCLVAVGTLLALATGGTRGGALDPEAARQHGGQALRVLLEQRGIDVVRVTEPSLTPGTTTFVPIAALLHDDVDRSALVPAAGRDVVLVAPGELLSALTAEDPRLTLAVAGTTEVKGREPGACMLRAAQVAGRAHTGGEHYVPTASTVGCYLVRGYPSVAVVPHDGGELRVVGATDLFENRRLDEQGNAALALGLLSGQSRVEWVYPREGELAALGVERRSLVDLLPDPVVLAVVQLGIAAVWLGVWRARRLGPVVVEPLPAVVRAAETVEGRAGLYRAAQARPRAAHALQAAARRRLALALGLGVAPERDALRAAVAARTGRDPTAVDDLLYGRSPGDDAALVRIARDLDTLDGEVRHL